MIFQITVINGPPGTGKTYTSLGIMSVMLNYIEFNNPKGKILACSSTNSVINDWVRKIALPDQDFGNYIQD